MAHLLRKLRILPLLALPWASTLAASNAEEDSNQSSLLEPRQLRCYVPSKNGFLWLTKELRPDSFALAAAHKSSISAMVKSGKLDAAVLRDTAPLFPLLRQKLSTALQMPYWQSNWKTSFASKVESRATAPSIGLLIGMITINILAESQAGRWEAALRDFELLNQLGEKLRDSATDIPEYVMGYASSLHMNRAVGHIICTPNTPNAVLAELARIIDDTPLSLEGWREVLRHELRLWRAHSSGIDDCEEYLERLSIGDESHGISFQTEGIKQLNDNFTYFFNQMKTNELMDARFAQMIQLVDEPFGETGHPSVNFSDGLNLDGNLDAANSLGAMFAVISSRRVSSEPVLKRFLRVHSSRTLVRTALAVEFYRREQGKLPERLENLVPKYLKQLPVDRLDGKVIGYDAAKRILFTTGHDLKRKMPETPEVTGLTIEDTGDVFRFQK